MYLYINIYTDIESHFSFDHETHEKKTHVLGQNGWPRYSNMWSNTYKLVEKNTLPFGGSFRTRGSFLLCQLHSLETSLPLSGRAVVFGMCDQRTSPERWASKNRCYFLLPDLASCIDVQQKMKKEVKDSRRFSMSYFLLIFELTKSYLFVSLPTSNRSWASSSYTSIYHTLPASFFPEISSAASWALATACANFTSACCLLCKARSAREPMVFCLGELTYTATFGITSWLGGTHVFSCWNNI